MVPTHVRDGNSISNKSKEKNTGPTSTSSFQRNTSFSDWHVRKRSKKFKNPHSTHSFDHFAAHSEVKSRRSFVLCVFFPINNNNNYEQQATRAAIWCGRVPPPPPILRKLLRRFLQSQVASLLFQSNSSSSGSISKRIFHCQFSFSFSFPLNPNFSFVTTHNNNHF